ncbi:MAG: preprotein translocase subunit YajC [Peptococcaceae bacterium]|jgi:preprotein translocase subunit YajC|nr:preprotein translocase subunit YajC [Peptococcaceae bacterium]
MPTWVIAIYVVGLGGLMYFMSIRPQRKQQKERAAMISNMKKGDRIVTIGGLYGIIRSIRDDRVTLEIATEVYVTFSKSAIANILKSSEEKATEAPEPETVIDKDDAAMAVEDAEYIVEQDDDQQDE